jgi:hypothetical protein
MLGAILEDGYQVGMAHADDAVFGDELAIWEDAANWS